MNNIAFVLLHAEYCHIVVSSFHCKFDRQQGRLVCPADRDTLHTHSIDISNPGDRSGNCRNPPARSPRRFVMIETGLFLHQPFKGPILAGSKVHSVASFLNLGMKKAADFFQNLRQSWITETGAALCDNTRFYLI